MKTAQGSLQSCGLTCVTQPQSANTPAVAKAKKKRRSKDKDSKSSNRRRASGEEPSSERRMKSLHKRVKLSDSWKLASDRSVARLLHSEHDTASFDGFNGSAQDLPSDVTYVDASEVELGASESKDWLLTDNTTTDCDTTLVPHDDTSCQGAKTGLGDLLKFVPNFSSPGKIATDSSWGDACDSYLTTNLTHTSLAWNDTLKSPKRSALESSFTSPVTRSSPRKFHMFAQTKSAQKTEISNSSFSHSHSCKESTPVKKSSQVPPSVASPSVQQVDDVVSFNYASPQRLLSPIKRKGNKDIKIPNRPDFSVQTSSSHTSQSPNHKSKSKANSRSK